MDANAHVHNAALLNVNSYMIHRVHYTVAHSYMIHRVHYTVALGLAATRIAFVKIKLSSAKDLALLQSCGDSTPWMDLGSYTLNGVRDDVLSLFPHLMKKDMTVELSHVDDFVGMVKMTKLLHALTHNLCTG